MRSSLNAALRTVALDRCALKVLCRCSMTSLNFGIAAAHIATGVLLIAVARPLVQGKIKPNNWYGVRIPKSFESEANWYALNRFGGQRLIFWSRFIVAVGVAGLFLPLHDNKLLALIVGLLPAVLVMIPTLEILRFSKTL